GAPRPRAEARGRESGPPPCIGQWSAGAHLAARKSHGGRGVETCACRWSRLVALPSHSSRPGSHGNCVALGFRARPRVRGTLNFRIFLEPPCIVLPSPVSGVIRCQMLLAGRNCNPACARGLERLGIFSGTEVLVRPAEPQQTTTRSFDLQSYTTYGRIR